MPAPDFTTVVVVDREHLKELQLSWPTWMKWKPWLRKHQFTLVVDDLDAFEDSDFNHGLDFLRDHPSVTIEVTHANPGRTQREKMLAASVLHSSFCDTPYYLKLDTDCVATGPGEPQAEWFADSPAIVASPWGYTKPGSWLEILDRWADGLEYFKGTQPPHRAISGNYARSRRIISWCMFGRTDFAQQIVDLCGGSNAFEMPVPSQDTTLWYAAARIGERISPVAMRHHGWQHVHPSRLAAACSESVGKHDG